MTYESITEISFQQVRKLVREELSTDEAMDAIDAVYGAIIAVSPAVLGPAGLALLPLIGVKNELMKLGKLLVRKLSASPNDYLGRSERMAAANCLITFTSFFEALSQKLPKLTEKVALTASERRTQAVQASRRLAAQYERSGERPGDKTAELGDRPIALPHPAADLDAETRARTELYNELANGFLGFMSGLEVWEKADEAYRDGVRTVLQGLPDVAAKIYQDQYLALMADYPVFLIWANLYEHAKTRKQSGRMSAELKRHAALVADLADSIDQGMAKLTDAIAAVQPAAPVTGTKFDGIVTSLKLAYADNIATPVIDDRYTKSTSEQGRLKYPSKSEIFIPQAFKVLRYDQESRHLENEEVWDSQQSRNDLGPFIVRYLESAYGAEGLLLVLGHPGSGKSLLTEMLVARLAPGFTAVRVELRDIDAEADLQSQIEKQIRRDTGQDVSWPQFSGAMSGTPPLVILDGFDELLQASGKVFGHYLDKVERFQHRERVQGRPVRIIVTSRITLIDKAAIPARTTVLRLLEFDEERRSLWTRQWNRHNQRYFAKSKVSPFAVPDNPKVLQLAEQPLLLLMLAVYDSAANQLSRNPNLDQTLLYHNLLTRFIERERRKGEAGMEFSALPAAERSTAIDDDLERLGVAAIGMFNRQTLHIQRAELDADIAYFGLVREISRGTDGHRLSQADLLIGSFFFIHESKSSTSDPDPDMVGQPTAFEFLHNTFGEFLAADFILRQVLKQSTAIGKLRADPTFLSVLEQRLVLLEDYWFSCLVYTPLHTRPVILEMLAEWFAHKLSDAGRSRQDVLAELDTILYRQLQETLLGTPPAPLVERRPDTPYKPLPLLGYLATYTLNLVMLRTVLGAASFDFDESRIGVTEGTCRPWEQMVQLWRSWLPLESLTGVAAIIDAVRGEEMITVRRKPSFATRASRSRLDDVFNVADALGDDLLCALAGLTVHNGSAEEAEAISGAVSRIARENIDLGPHWTALRARRESRPSGEFVQALKDHINDPVVEPYGPALLEVLRAVGTSAEIAERVEVEPSSPATLVALSRYQAELYVDVKNRLEPRWLPHIFDTYSGSKDGVLFELLARSLAGAPLLRCATMRMPNRGIGRGVSRLNELDALGWVRSRGLIDLQTAAAMARLAGAYYAAELCNAALASTVEGFADHGWQVSATPLEYLRLLADALTSKDADSRVVAEVRAAVKENVDVNMRDPLDLRARRDSRIRLFKSFVEIARIVHSDEAISAVVDFAAETPDGPLVGYIEFLLPVVRLARELKRQDILYSLENLFMSAPGGPQPSLGGPVSALTAQDLNDLRWAMAQRPKGPLLGLINETLRIT